MAPTPWVRTGPGSRVGATSGPGCGADLHPPPSLAARQPWTSWEGCWCWTATRGSVRPRPWPTPTSASTTTPRTSPRPSPMTRAWRLRSAPWRSGRVGLGGWREMGGGGRGLPSLEAGPCLFAAGRAPTHPRGGLGGGQQPPPQLRGAVRDGLAHPAEQEAAQGRLWTGRGPRLPSDGGGPGLVAAGAHLPLPPQSSPTRKSSASSPQGHRSLRAAWTLSSEPLWNSRRARACPPRFRFRSPPGSHRGCLPPHDPWPGTPGLHAAPVGVCAHI